MTPIKSRLQSGFRLGPWTVIPERGRLRRGNIREHLEPMVMDVLVVLATHQGSVVTRDQLVHEVWKDRFVTDEAIVAKIATLRQKLGDDSRNPKYIETIPRRGYRLIMAVEAADAPAQEQEKRPVRRLSRTLLMAGIVALALAAIYWWPPPGPTAIDSVAVLQFKNLSDNKAKYDPWVAGFREELFIDLGRVPKLNVAKGPVWSDEISAQQLAKKLGVDAFVNGSLRANGDKIVITAELISVNGFQIWSNKFDRVAEDIFQLQEIVAREVRTALGRETGGRQQSQSPSRNLERYDKYSRGLLFLEKRDVVSLQRARNLFQQTIDVDAKFGPAYLRLAITLLLLSDYSADQRREIFQQAIDVAKQGVQADPDIREAAEMVYGFVHHQFGDWGEAEQAFASSFRGPAIYPTAYHWHSRLLSSLGLLDRSLAQAIKARSIEPASQVLNSRVAIAYLWKNDMPNARHFFEEANSMGVGAPIHHFGYTMFLIRDNRLEDARASAKHAHELLQADDWWVDPVFNGLENPEISELRAIAFEAIHKMVADGVPPYITMITWALFDQPDQAMKVAMQIADSGSLYAYESAQVEIFYLDEMKSFREHPDFPELLQKLGLTDYWASIGCRWHMDQVLCDAG
jgi:DNA-binding winged helix-turn-helix (wHTH) protein/TolB-like protein